MDVHGILAKILSIKGIRADYKETVYLIEEVSAEALMAGQGYGINDILAYVTSDGIESVILSKKRKE